MFRLLAFAVFENMSLASALLQALQCESMGCSGVHSLQEFRCSRKEEEALDIVIGQEMGQRLW